MARDSGTFEAFRPYVDRAIHDDDVKDNVLRAWRAARTVYRELSGEGPLGAAGKFSRDEDLRDEIDTTVQNLSEAIVRMSGEKPRNRSGWSTFLVIALIVVVLFNPATGASTRKWIKDHLFGSEEEFDYAAPTY